MTMETPIFLDRKWGCEARCERWRNEKGNQKICFSLTNHLWRFWSTPMGMLGILINKIQEGEVPNYDWLVVLVAINFIFPWKYWVSIIIPIDELIFFRGVALAHQPDDVPKVDFRKRTGGHRIKMTEPGDQHHSQALIRFHGDGDILWDNLVKTQVNHPFGNGL